MNSSTSAFDIARWRGFVILAVGVIAAIVVTLVGIAYALDPYDTGYGLVHFPGAFAKGPRLNRISRLRDEQFDAAIIGNSHILSLSPRRLSQQTGLHFVMLGVPGTGAPEQMQILDAYLARHSPPRALIFGLDAVYCVKDPRASPPTPFPDWLYGDRLSYAFGLARLSTVQMIGRRVALIGGFGRPQPQDGTFDLYDEPLDPGKDAQRLASAPREDLGDIPDERPGLVALRARLSRLPASTAVLALWPPVYAPTLPAPDSPAAHTVAACKAAVADLRQVHARTAVVDWHRVRTGTDVATNFYDPTHYYDGLASAVEQEISAALRNL